MSANAPEKSFRSMHHKIEQAIARGEDLDAICARLNVPAHKVEAVMTEMDEALDDDPWQLDYEPVRRELQPHGTHAAFVRHRNWKEAPCAACWDAERLYDAEKHRRYRDARRAAKAGAA